MHFQFVARNLWILFLKRKFGFTVNNKNYNVTLKEIVIVKITFFLLHKFICFPFIKIRQLKYKIQYEKIIYPVLYS